MRLLLLDDASTDAAIVAELAALQPQARNSVQMGVAGSLNRLLSMCDDDVEFVARMDADDIAEPDRLARQCRYLREHPDVDVVGSNATLFSDHSAATRVTTLPTQAAAVHFGMLFACTLVHPSVMFRRRVAPVYDAVGHPHAEDYALWHALLRRGCKLANIAAPLLRLRKHVGSVSHQFAAEQRRSSAALAPLAYSIAQFASIDAVFEHHRAILDAAPLLCAWAGDKFSADERRQVADCAQERAAELLALAAQRFPAHATRIIQAMPAHLLATLLATLAAPPPALPPAPRSPSSIAVLLFTKDRPFQAHQCLRSFIDCVVEPNVALRFDVTVLCCATLERTRAQYAALRSALPAFVRFVDETDESTCRAVLQTTASCSADLVLFLVDDALFYRAVALAADGVLERLGSGGLFAVQLRLHPQVRHSVTADAACPAPRSLESRGAWCTWRADADDARIEWRYPFDLSGALYRTSTVAAIVRLLGDAALSHPNRFEVAGNDVVLRRRLLTERCETLACPAQPCMSLVTINRVQSVCDNAICGEPHSIDELCDCFERKAAFDTASYCAASPAFISTHIGDFFLKPDSRF